MSIAAIIVTHNSEKHVGACLSSLAESQATAWVVDNASSDGTVSFVAERFPRVRLVVNRKNLGFAAAVNQALERTSAETIVLVNPDCVVPPQTMIALAQYLELHPGVGVVAPRLLDVVGEAAISTHPFETAATILASRFGGSVVPLWLRRRLSSGARSQSYMLCRDGTEPLAVDWVSGACLAVRGSTFRRLGGLDAGYFMYYEDEELCLQVQGLGETVVYLPGFDAMHLGGGSTSDPAQAWPHLYRSMLRFQARHRPRTYRLVRIAILVRAILGVGLGLPRDAAALAKGRPGRRSLAWARIARVVLDGTPSRCVEAS